MPLDSETVEATRASTVLTESVVTRETVGLTSAAEGQVNTISLYRGGVLGSRSIVFQPDGTYTNITPAHTYAEGDSTGVRASDLDRCSYMPVAFFQEIMHRARIGKRDELVYEQPGQVEGHPGIKLNIDTLNFKHNGLPLTHYAKTQLCGHARVPVEYFHRLVEKGAVQLAAMNVNVGMRLRSDNVRGARDGKFLVRIKDEVVDGVLTDSYGIWDNHDMLDAFVECFPQEMVSSLMVSYFWSDGRDIEGTVVIPDEWTNEPGTVFGVGVAFRNSENGRRSLSFVPFVARNGQVGLTYDKKETLNGVLELKHTSGINVVSIKEEIRESIPQLIRSANSLRTHLINSKQILLPNPADVLALLAIRFGIAPSISRTWYDLFLVDNSSSAFGLIDSLMETSLLQPFEVKLALQTFAGQILIDNLGKSEAELVQMWMTTIIPAAQRLRRNSTGPERIEEYTVGLQATDVPRTRRRNARV